MTIYIQISLLIAVLIIVALGGYALYLYRKLRQKDTERKQQEAILSEELSARRDSYRNSIRVIASAIVQEQVSLTEGAIRISMLASQLELSELERADYQVFFQLTESTSHIPILQEWKKLSKKDKRRYDQERESLEESFREFVVASANKLVASYGVVPAKREALFYSVGKE
jgi:hypothetical protein